MFKSFQTKKKAQSERGSNTNIGTGKNFRSN